MPGSNLENCRKSSTTASCTLHFSTLKTEPSATSAFESPLCKGGRGDSKFAIQIPPFSRGVRGDSKFAIRIPPFSRGVRGDSKFAIRIPPFSRGVRGDSKFKIELFLFCFFWINSNLPVTRAALPPTSYCRRALLIKKSSFWSGSLKHAAGASAHKPLIESPFLVAAFVPPNAAFKSFSVQP
jgi:hypothetical protein